MKKFKEQVGLWVLRFMTYLLVAVIFFILGNITKNGIGTMTWDFLTTMPRHSGAEGGIFPVIVGTLYLVAGTIILALPIGMATAIYLSEYAKKGLLTENIRLAIFTLSGVPSIVFGLLGLAFFVIFLGFGTSIISGSFTLAMMILPVIIVASEEALRSVPHSLRDASLALGATRWQTIWHNVIPYSLPGMITGSILGIARAGGETAPILFTAAAFYLPWLPHSVFDPVMALPYHLYVLATQLPDPAAIRDNLYGTAFVLLVLILGINLVAVMFRNYFRKKYRW